MLLHKYVVITYHTSELVSIVPIPTSGKNFTFYMLSLFY
jgi:hypothetical protein